MKEKTTDWWEIAYLTIYGMILLHDFLDTTMFPITWPSRIGYVFFAAVMLFMLAKLRWKNDYTKKELAASAAILAAFLIPAFMTEYSFLFEIGFLIVGAKGIKLDRILKVYLIIGISVMLVAFAASQAGWIENLVYLGREPGQIRNSFGIIYPTDFAAHVFYLVLAGTCINNRITTIPDILMVLFLAIFVWKACEARTGFLCLGIYAVLLLIVKFGKVGKRRYLLCSVPIVCCVVFLVLTAGYQAGMPICEKIDTFLSGRLQLSAQGIAEYGYSLFGQNIKEIGNGGTVIFNYDYFFLDDSYIRIALEYGIVLLIVVLVLLTRLIQNSIHTKRVLLTAAIIMVCIHSVMEQHLLEIAYNPFLFGLFADCSYDREKSRKSIFLISLDGYEI